MKNEQFINTYKEGDIIYGIGAEITKYIKFYHSKKHQRYIDWDAAQAEKSERGAAINYYNMPITQQNFKKTYTPIEKNTNHYSGNVRAYHTALESSRYAPHNVMTLPDEKLKKSRSDVESLKRYQKAGARKDYAIRRSSKYGIDYFSRDASIPTASASTTSSKNIESDTTSPQSTVHYVLDGMDIATIARKKTHLNKTIQAEKVPICTSELRFMFRNWGSLRQRNRIKFWKDYVSSQPPWELGDTVAWALYALHRLKKLSERKAQKHLFTQILDRFFKENRIDLENIVGDMAPAHGNQVNIDSLELSARKIIDGETAKNIIEYYHGFAGLESE